MAPLVFGRALLRLVALRLTGRIDVLHLSTSSRGSTLRKVQLGLLARLLRLPYVIQLHSGDYEDFVSGLSSPLRWMVRAYFANAAHVFVLGEVFRPMASTLLRVPPDRLSVVPNTVDLPAELVREAGETPPVILFTGRLGRRKGVFDLVEALARIGHLPWTAVLAGDGDIDAIVGRLARAGLTDRVSVRPWQGRAAIEELLVSSDVFALPSWAEALSISLLEAMASGLCCVATPVGAQAEYLVDGENALVVEPGDAAMLADRLAKAVTDPELRLRLGAEARDLVDRRCSLPAVVEELGRRYERILG